MNRNKLFFIIPAALITLLSCNNDDKNKTISENSNTNANDISMGMPTEIKRLEFPKVKGGKSIIIVHRTNDRHGVNFCTEWDTEMRAQRWSCYQMHDGNSGGHVGRYDTSQFGYPHDEDMPFEYQLQTDPYYPYRKTGFEHGHICPSADRQYSKSANKQTFYLSNMQPQYKEFNETGYIWELMERQIRTWNDMYVGGKAFRDTLYICKGGTIDDGRIIKHIGNDTEKIPVPKYFFMAVLCKNQSGYKAIGFFVEHKRYGKNEKVADHVCNIRQLEELTGIDFFCNLPDKTENSVETLDKEMVKKAWGLQ